MSMCFHYVARKNDIYLHLFLCWMDMSKYDLCPIFFRFLLWMGLECTRKCPRRFIIAFWIRYI
jgi:hypothetical protein